MKLNEKLRKKQGITIVALVVTVIVLLILLSISIAVLTGDKGVITNAQNAKSQAEIAKVEKEAQLVYTTKMKKKEPTLSDVAQGLKDEEYTIVTKRGSGNKVTGVELSKNPILVDAEGNTTAEISLKLITEDVRCYVEISGEYHQIILENGKATVLEEVVDISKIDEEDEEETEKEIKVSTSNPDTATAELSEDKKEITVYGWVQGKTNLIVEVDGQKFEASRITVNEPQVRVAVYHDLETLTEGQYETKDTDTYNERKKTTITPKVNTYTGFTSPTAEEVYVDGAKEVHYKYRRNSYEIKLNAGKGIAGVTGAGTHKYEEEVTINATVKPGYTWVNWTGEETIEEKEHNITMPAKNIEYTANAEDITKPTKPTYTAYHTGDSTSYTSGNWTNREVGTRITSIDEGSGVVEIQYTTTPSDASSWKKLETATGNLAKQADNKTFIGTEAWAAVDNKQETIYFRTKDAEGNYSDTSDAFTYKYDLTPPTLTSINVTGPAAGTYKAGTEIEITTTYSEAIYGTTAGAAGAGITESTAPKLKIKFGDGTEREVTFKSASGDKIVYKYTIQEGDNGELTTTSHEGTVYDKGTTSLTVSNKTVGGNKIVADTKKPEVTSIAVTTGPGIYKAGDELTIEVTFSEDIYDEDIKEQVEIYLKYEGYIAKAYKEAEKMLKLEKKQIPDNIDYDKVNNIASEARQKLKEVRPRTIAQAIRISGVNPSDISILSVYLKKEYSKDE